MKRFDSVAIVGVGLIGGSIGLALRARKLADRLIGAGSRPETLQTALGLGAITEIAADVTGAAAEADLVVVCAPVGHIVEQVRRIAPHCRPGTLITDAGSTKGDIVRQLAEAAANDKTWNREIHFVGSHPLAGNEKKGPMHADAELFSGRTVIITPTASTTQEVRRSLTDFWTSLGAAVIEMPADEHDRALAATSHLPHLLAAAIAGATPERYVSLTAGGWQDTTRIAAGDPSLWRQIMLANRANVLAVLDEFTTRLAAWRACLEAQDAVELEKLLTEAKRIRDAVGS
ncbi:MAG: prephenate dehydrogenase/arogenate dehydrogenase family protein [Pirellulales bacterium]